MNAPSETLDCAGLVASMGSVESDADRTRFRATYAADRDPASLAVVALVAVATGRDLTDLDSLQGAVDTDALDALFSDSESGPQSGHLSFQYEGFTVTVFGEGRVEARTGGPAA